MKLFISSVILLIITIVIVSGDAHLLRKYADVYQTLQECQNSEAGYYKYYLDNK